MPRSSVPGEELKPPVCCRLATRLRKKLDRNSVCQKAEKKSGAENRCLLGSYEGKKKGTIHILNASFKSALKIQLKAHVFLYHRGYKQNNPITAAAIRLISFLSRSVVGQKY